METFEIKPIEGIGLTYRALRADEWHKLAPIFRENDWFLPDPSLAMAIVAENDDNEIVHVQIYQLVLHAEPTWTDEDYRGKVNYKTCWNMFKDKPKRSELLLPGFVLVAPDEHIAKLAKAAGFKEIPGKLFKAEFKE